MAVTNKYWQKDSFYFVENYISLLYLLFCTVPSLLLKLGTRRALIKLYELVASLLSLIRMVLGI